MKALLLIDIQNDYFKGGLFPLAGMSRAALNARALLESFRKEGLPVIHIRHIGDRKGSRFFFPGTKGSEIHALVRPLEGEKILIKHYPNSFRETGLDALLKDLAVDELHVAGAMTNMCVDSTVRAGFDLGYRMVLHDKACAAKGLLGSKIVHLVTVRTLVSAFATIER